MTTTIREFKMEVTERSDVAQTANRSVSTSSSAGRTSFTIQIPAAADQPATARSVSVEQTGHAARQK